MKNIGIEKSIERLVSEVKELEDYLDPIFEYMNSTELLGNTGADYQIKMTRIVCSIEDLKRRLNER